MPSVDWTWYNLPLQSVDEDASMIRPAVVGAYALGAQKKRTWNGVNTAWFTNCPEGMLEDGNWYASQSEKRIYLVSSDDTPPSDISMPTLQEYVKIEGTVGKDIEDDIPVRYLIFRDWYLQMANVTPGMQTTIKTTYSMNGKDMIMEMPCCVSGGLKIVW